MPPEPLFNPRTAEIAELRALSSGDLIQQLFQLEPDELAALFLRLGDEGVAELVTEFDATDAARLIGRLSRAHAANVLEEMDPDDAADVVGELEDDEAESVLREMEPEEARDVRDLLQYGPATAGGVMTTEYLAVSPDLTADEALAVVRAKAREAETVYYFYVTEPGTRKLLGVLSLRSLILSAPDARVRDLMVTNPVRIRADADQEEAAQLLDRNNLLAIPVVDRDDRILGILTADDAQDVLQEEASEDIERLGGSQPLDAPYMRASLATMIKKRAGWLTALFLGEMLTATALGYFQDELGKAVVLALFLPLIISSGGNSGSQATTLVIRAMALGEVRLRDWGRVILREAPTGLVLGLLLATIGMIRISAWQFLGITDYGQFHWLVALTVSLSLVCVVLYGTVVGAMLPFLIRRLGFDPASASAPFIATMVDVSGLVIYFTIGKVVLAGTLL